MSDLMSDARAEERDPAGDPTEEGAVENEGDDQPVTGEGFR
jgi:hypothetical protein